MWNADIKVISIIVDLPPIIIMPAGGKEKFQMERNELYGAIKEHQDSENT